METFAAIILTTPPMLGGFGLGGARLNFRIDTTSEATRISKNSYFLCDIYWPNARLDVEYDSDAFHTGSARITKDARRRNALLSMGIQTLTLTREQITDAQSMIDFALIVAKKIGKRVKSDDFGRTPACMELRRALIRQIKNR